MRKHAARCKTVYEQCLSDTQRLLGLFDSTDHCTDVAFARELMEDLKQHWKERIKEGKGTDIYLVVSDALSRITVKSSSRPGPKWASDLRQAEVGLRFYIRQ